MIEIQSLTKRYRKHTAIDDIDLSLEHGMFGLLGPNGAGKTTLMRIMATLLTPTAGDVVIDGVSLKKNPEKIREKVGYLPQFFRIYPQMTGYEFLDYIAVMKGIHQSSKRKQVIANILEHVNLSNKAKKKVKTYSGGMKQRLGIAQALLAEPDILIVDEPTAGLDPEERVRFRNLLASFSINHTVVLSTHIVADIESSCDQVAVLNEGKIMLMGQLDDLQACASNKVWELYVDNKPALAQIEGKIVSTKKVTDGFVCKVISDHKPTSEARQLESSLEDGYLALIGRDHHV